MDTLEGERPSASTLEIALYERAHGWAVDVQDDEGGRRVPLAGGRMVVGSSSRADIVVCDPTVSSQHCALTPIAGGAGGGGVLIEDLGSKNGTFVGSARVREARGLVGSTIVVGHTSLVIGRSWTTRRRTSSASRSGAWRGRRARCAGSPRACDGSRTTRCPCW